MPTPTASSAPPPPETGLQKVSAALADGDIDADTALLYELYSVVGDPRLPGDLQGAPDPEVPEADLLQLAARLPDLSPDLQAAATPFFLAPTDPQSYWYQLNAAGAVSGSGGLAALAGTEAVVAAASGGPVYAVLGTTDHVKVWYVPGYNTTTDATNQHDAQVVLDNAEAIWSKEDGLMPNHVVSDGPLALQSPPINNGGDGKLDIYVGHTASQTAGESDDGLTVPYPGFAAGPLPSFVLVSDQEDEFTTPTTNEQVSADDHVRGTLAHEIFHTYQDAVPRAPFNAPNAWWWEASATWAEQFVFPTDDAEQGRLGNWIASDGPPPLDLAHDTDVTTEDPQTGDLSATGFYSPAYSNYTWPLYLVQESKSDKTIGTIWQNMSGGKNVMDVIGGLVDVPTAFAQYALWTWDEPNSPSDMFRDHGARLSNTAHAIADSHQVAGIDTNDAHHGQRFLPVISDDPSADLPELSMTYYDIENPGPNTHQLRIDWSEVSGASVDVQAMTELKGQTKYQDVRDWSGRKSYTFCLDNPLDDVDKIVVIMDNPDQTKSATGWLGVHALSAPCAAGSGTINFSSTVAISSSQTVTAGGATGKWAGNYRYLENVTANLTLKPDVAPIPDEQVWSVEAAFTIAIAGGERFAGGARAGKVTSYTFGIRSSVDGLASAHDPPQPGDPLYDQEVANGEDPADIAMEYGTLTLMHDPDTGQDSYDLELSNAWSVTPTFNYDSTGQGSFLGLAGSCTVHFDNGSGVLQHTNCQQAPPDQDMGAVTAPVDLPDISGGTYDAKSGVVSLSSSSETGDCDSVLAGSIGDSSPMLAFDATPWDQFAAPLTMSCDGVSNLSMSIQVPGQAPASP